MGQAESREMMKGPKPIFIITKRVTNVDMVNAQYKVFTDLNGRP